MAKKIINSYDHNDPIDRDIVQEQRDKELGIFEEQEISKIKKCKFYHKNK